MMVVIMMIGDLYSTILSSQDYIRHWAKSTESHTERKTTQQSWVLKTSRDLEIRMSTGSLFHSLGAADVNVRPWFF